MCACLRFTRTERSRPPIKRGIAFCLLFFIVIAAPVGSVLFVCFRFSTRLPTSTIYFNDYCRCYGIAISWPARFVLRLGRFDAALHAPIPENPTWGNTVVAASPRERARFRRLPRLRPHGLERPATIGRRDAYSTKATRSISVL